MNKNALIYAVAALLFAGFVLSVITGYTVGQTGAIATRRHVRDHTRTLDNLLTALKLTPEQRTNFEPVLVQATPELAAIRADACQTRHKIIDRALGQIRPLLTLDQRKKLDELQQARRDLQAARDKVQALTME